MLRLRVLSSRAARSRSELKGGGGAARAVEDEGVVERLVLVRGGLDGLLRGDAAHHRRDRVHLGAAPPQELAEQLVRHVRAVGRRRQPELLDYLQVKSSQVKSGG